MGTYATADPLADLINSADPVAVWRGMPLANQRVILDRAMQGDDPARRSQRPRLHGVQADVLGSGTDRLTHQTDAAQATLF